MVGFLVIEDCISPARRKKTSRTFGTSMKTAKGGRI